jgi:putative endonuclease
VTAGSGRRLPEVPTVSDSKGSRARAAAEARTKRAGAAETAVADYLMERGFTVVARNLRLGRLELDVVARRDALIVIVEVRTRGSGAWTTAFGSIDSSKRRRIRQAGERLWQRRYKRDASVERVRFDAASVSFDGAGCARVEYVEAAF